MITTISKLCQIQIMKTNIATNHHHILSFQPHLYFPPGMPIMLNYTMPSHCLLPLLSPRPTGVFLSFLTVSVPLVIQGLEPAPSVRNISAFPLAGTPSGHRSQCLDPRECLPLPASWLGRSKAGTVSLLLRILGALDG